MRKGQHGFVLIPLIAALVALPAAPLAAAESSAGPAAAPAANANAGTPATSVARLRSDKGTAWVRPADSGEWQEYGTNTPLGERFRVSVPHGSQAQILVREGQSLVLKSGAEVEIRELGEKHDTFRLQSGSVGLSMTKDGFAPVRFRVPGNREVDIAAPGRYAVGTEAGTSKFVVGAGEGTVSGEGMTPVSVKAGEEASIGAKITVARTESTAPAPPPAGTEPQLTEAERQAGVPPEAAGELREYGHWVYTPDYGYAWSPYVDAGWTPYYYGHWVWVYPYGWVWVAYEPWGWWPYHYGWWVDDLAFGWVWCPFHAFIDVDFFFGHSRFFFHRASFFAANVRFDFDRDGRFVRWTPARPGTAATRAPFSRGDGRLAQWNEPLRSGEVMVRGENGRMRAWQGHGMAAADAGVGGRAALRNAGVQPFREGGGRVSAALPAAMNRGSRGARPESGGRQPGAGPAVRGESRGFEGSRGVAVPREPTPRMSAPPSRTFEGPVRSAPPSRSFEGGGFRGFEGRPGGFRSAAPPERSFAGGGFRGFSGGGSRGFSGGGGGRGFGGGRGR